MKTKTKTNELKFLSAGDTALVIQLGETVDVQVNQKVRQLASIVQKQSIAGIIDLVPTMLSLMMHYDPLAISRAQLEGCLMPLLELETVLEEEVRRWNIPVCYEGEFAPDMDDVTRSLNVSAEELVRQHTSVELEVFMMGFLPGFPYVGLLPEIFDLPRRVEPRVHVPPRSISVAARQTTIYTINSPGGWHLIGQTPIDFYDSSRSEAILVRAGDRIKFSAISAKDYPKIRRDAKAGVYQLEMTN